MHPVTIPPTHMCLSRMATLPCASRLNGPRIAAPLPAARASQPHTCHYTSPSHMCPISVHLAAARATLPPPFQLHVPRRRAHQLHVPCCCVFRSCMCHVAVCFAAACAMLLRVSQLHVPCRCVFRSCMGHFTASSQPHWPRCRAPHHPPCSCMPHITA